ncbi:spore protease YyaC [Paenibacillus sp. NPDC058071]|uniref:spore protease YyaC n=1 Tax=Paenibacillus sp. NPDC058071 TaxID=3346326 RepID=UPI0036DC6235
MDKQLTAGNRDKQPAVPLQQRLEPFLANLAERHPERAEIVFLCIGTDRSTGDCFGPMVGSMLKKQGWPNVVGTLEHPCDANRVEQAMRELTPFETVIAIDACLGKPQSAGGYVCSDGPLRPGAATGANLPAAGRYGIAGVVNTMSKKPYFTLQTTSLHRVISMASKLSLAIEEAWSAGRLQSEQDNRLHAANGVASAE